MERCDANGLENFRGQSSDERVWLMRESDEDMYPQSICLRFRHGALSTMCGEPLSFRDEAYLMNSLQCVHDLLGRIYFDGMPLENFQSILEKIRTIEFTNSQLRKSSDEVQQKALYEKCDSIWSEVLAEVAESIKVSLQNEERSI